MRDDFAVFILSHGRANNVKTIGLLKNINYTGKTYIIIDDEDKMADEYYKRYGDMVIMFDKKKSAELTDTADNIQDRRAVVFARNTVHQIASDLKLTYFLVLDDDYNGWLFRYVEGEKLKSVNLRVADKLFEATLRFLDVSNAKAIAYAQGGDFIGGAENELFHKGIIRKAMNVFFCRTDRPFQFYGKINEDLTTYIYLGSQGHLFFTLTKSSINQVQTQKNVGGLTDIYLDLGTYVKSFYSVMYMPSCVSISPMGVKNKRLHHRVKWDSAVPKIIEERYRKRSDLNGRG